MKHLSWVMLLTAALAVSPSAFGKVEKKEPQEAQRRRRGDRRTRRR